MLSNHRPDYTDAQCRTRCPRGCRTDRPGAIRIRPAFTQRRVCPSDPSRTSRVYFASFHQQRLSDARIVRDTPTIDLRTIAIAEPAGNGRANFPRIIGEGRVRDWRGWPRDVAVIQCPAVALIVHFNAARTPLRGLRS